MSFRAPSMYDTYLLLVRKKARRHNCKLDWLKIDSVLEEEDNIPQLPDRSNGLRSSLWKFTCLVMVACSRRSSKFKVYVNRLLTVGQKYHCQSERSRGPGIGLSGVVGSFGDSKRSSTLQSDPGM